jgi:toxin FitB
VSIIVLDTDVASASLRNRLPDQLQARLAGQTMAITFVTVGELAKWRALRSWGLNGSPAWPGGANTSPCSSTTRRSPPAGAGCRHAPNCGAVPAPHNDTWIAACCLVDNLPLATLNTKDFADFAEHDGLTLI